MAFEPTYKNLDERQPWENRFFTQTVAELIAHLSNLNGTDFAAPFQLSRSGQDLDGQDHNIYSFRKWFGYGTADVCIRDVTGYGAKGDGSTDDAEAIQDAIDDMPITGGCLFFPSGTYVSSKTIYMAGTNGTRGKVLLSGVGAATTIKRDANSGDGPLIQMGATEAGADGMTIMNLIVDGNYANQGASATQSCISMVDTVNARILNCEITGSKKDGIHVFGSDRGMISGCLIHSHQRHGIYQGNIQRIAKKILIVDCIIRDNSDDGILLGPITNAQIENCRCVNNAGDGIEIASQPALGSSEITVLGCTCKDNGGSGVYISNQYPGVILNGIVLMGNPCTDNGAHGIRLSAAENAPIRFVSATGNLCDGNQESGIYLSSNVKYSTIAGNSAVNNKGSSTGSGIYADGEDDGNEVEYCSVTGNSCCNDASDSFQKYGIYFGTNTKNNSVVGNTAFGNETAQILDSGDDNDFAHNTGA